MNFKNSKFRKIILTIAIGIIVLSYLFWNYFLKPSILWHEASWVRKFEFLSAVLSYEDKFGRLPTSLEEMVSAGCLPEKSNIYSCPILHGTRFGKVLPYTECEYTITFDPNKIVIYIPKEVFDKWNYKKVGAYENLRKWEFGNDTINQDKK
jgi:hypothetical protein